MRIMKCDGCGKEVIESHYSEKEGWWRLDCGAGPQSTGKEDQDLCPKCIRKLEDLVNKKGGLKLSLGIKQGFHL